LLLALFPTNSIQQQYNDDSVKSKVLIQNFPFPFQQPHKKKENVNKYR
jgi:hypothetical protein